MTVRQYQIFEKRMKTNGADCSAVFSCGGKEWQVRSFQDGEETCIRFMPQETGTWNYTIFEKDRREEGDFDCIPAPKGEHGMVHTAGYHFRYADGTRYMPFGTTCYAWAHQSEECMEATLASLRTAPFNKVRMCVFPKSMAFNQNDPALYPFRKTADGKWDVHAPDERFWRHFERQVASLGAMGIEADIILFHPYDRWGFASLTMEENLIYLRYCVRRLSAYHNVWWSLANEYELLGRPYEEWDAYAEEVKENDAYGHLLSIHDFCTPYPKRDWMTHLSVQSAFSERALAWRSRYRIPVIDDECGYEGDLEYRWGNLSGRELVHRIWKGIVNGGYVTHGETFYNSDEVIWWAKGGTLKGEAVPRIAFLKALLEELGEVEPLIRLEALPKMEVGGQGTEFMRAMEGLSDAEREQVIVDMIPPVCGNDSCRLYYCGRGCPRCADVSAPGEGMWRVELIDTWEMTRKTVKENAEGSFCIELPAKEGMAILLKKKER